MLLGGELPDDPGDLGPLVLGALLGEPGPQVGDREGEVFDGALKAREGGDYCDCISTSISVPDLCLDIFILLQSLPDNMTPSGIGKSVM